MIPLKDNLRPLKFPLVNIFFIISCIVIFIYQLGLGNQAQMQFVFDYGVVPQRFFLLIDTPWVPEFWVPMLSSMFLHGGWLHLLGNILFLWVFGDNVEDRFGHFTYFLFYLLSGVVASTFHIAFNPLSEMPAIGASGAIAGVLGAYFILFPRAKVLALIPLGFFITTIYLPATVFLFLWFLLQLFNAVILETAGAAGTVAWWAHIGGFVCGIILALLYLSWKKILNY